MTPANRYAQCQRKNRTEKDYNTIYIMSNLFQLIKEAEQRVKDLLEKTNAQNTQKLKSLFEKLSEKLEASKEAARESARTEIEAEKATVKAAFAESKTQANKKAEDLQAGVEGAKTKEVVDELIEKLTTEML